MTTSSQLTLAILLVFYTLMVLAVVRPSQRSRHAARARKRLRQSLLNRRD